VFESTQQASLEQPYHYLLPQHTGHASLCKTKKCTTKTRDLNYEIREYQPENKQGIWEQTGYGDVQLVGAEGGELYEYTRQGCLKADTVDNEDLAEFFDTLALSEDGQTLTTIAEQRIDFDTRLDRLSALPDLCQPENLITQTTPTATFEHLWNTFNDHYAFFDERNVDWGELYAQLRPLVNDDLDDEELLEIFDALLSPLDDGHIQLETDDDEFDYAELRGIRKVIFDSFSDPSEFASEEQWFEALQEYANDIAAKYVEIRSSYLDEGSQESAGGSTGRRVSWGTINQQVGYLRVGAMIGISTGDDDSIEAELQAVDSIMQRVLLELQDTRGLIIDVRSNSGGHDAVSLAIANYFTDETRLAVSKYSRSYLGDTATVEAFISPALPSPYLQPIAVIGASDTSSAAEIFLMSMSALPNVTLVGWEISLSNEVYTDYLGVNHEVSGVPPQVQAETYSLQAIEQKRDLAIEKAIETLGF